MNRTHFDVIIVGGRPAGATLAARLGQHGLHVLLLERSPFPSTPAVSSPAIYSSTMALLDEIGADEAAYAQNTPRFRRWVTEVRKIFGQSTRFRWRMVAITGMRLTGRASMLPCGTLPPPSRPSQRASRLASPTS
jgi:flavin-dependent dehydrogenase